MGRTHDSYRELGHRCRAELLLCPCLGTPRPRSLPAKASGSPSSAGPASTRTRAITGLAVHLCLNSSIPMPDFQCSAVLFDLDGVLVDSTKSVVVVWTAWAEKNGISPD